jgi:hypothetical protein
MSKRKSRSKAVEQKSGRSTSLDGFNPDYSYVKKDLREIGILAGIFITILVVLSFII